MVTDLKDDPATLAMLKMMSRMLDDPRYAYEVRDALDTPGSRDGNGGVRLHAGATDHCGCGMNKHTPGPWTFDELSGDDARGMGYIFGADGREVSHHGVSERWRAENLANATLIVAAPDMLAALKVYIDLFDTMASGTGVDQIALACARDGMRSAIAKAEGQS